MKYTLSFITLSLSCLASFAGPTLNPNISGGARSDILFTNDSHVVVSLQGLVNIGTLHATNEIVDNIETNTIIRGSTLFITNVGGINILTVTNLFTANTITVSNAAFINLLTLTNSFTMLDPSDATLTLAGDGAGRFEMVVGNSVLHMQDSAVFLRNNTGMGVFFADDSGNVKIGVDGSTAVYQISNGNLSMVNSLGKYINLSDNVVTVSADSIGIGTGDSGNGSAELKSDGSIEGAWNSGGGIFNFIVSSAGDVTAGSVTGTKLKTVDGTFSVTGGQLINSSLTVLATNRLNFTTVSSLTNTLGREATAIVTAGTSVALQDTNGVSIATIGTVATTDFLIPMHVNMRLAGTGVSAILY